MLKHSQSRTALGSTVTITLVTEADEAYLNEVFRQLWIAVLTFEKRCSRFLPESELSQFNRAAGVRLPVSAEFRDVLLAAKQMGEQTEGLYNPFILPALQRAGYVKSLVKAYSKDPVDDYSDKSVVAVSKLEVGDTWAQIPYGTAIDLGGCGKGYAGDMLARIVRQFHEISGYWFSVGGDVAAGGLDETGQPWTVHIEATHGTQHMAGEVLMPDSMPAGVATSSTAVRKGRTRGETWHHIINPRTLKPSKSDIVTATVYAGTLLEADVLASCVIIVGSAQAKTYLESHGRDVRGVLLQCTDSSDRNFTKRWGVIQ